MLEQEPLHEAAANTSWPIIPLIWTAALNFTAKIANLQKLAAQGFRLALLGKGGKPAPKACFPCWGALGFLFLLLCKPGGSENQNKRD
jgi:hypothetical protein